MTLPQRIPKPKKRATRWKSTAHRDFVRSFACANCGSTGYREVAHVRMGSGAGMGQKPDDWRTVPLCSGPKESSGGHIGCHNWQHTIGEPLFWQQYAKKHGQNVEELIQSFIKASPRRQEIEATMRERGNG